MSWRQFSVLIRGLSSESLFIKSQPKKRKAAKYIEDPQEAEKAIAAMFR